MKAKTLIVIMTIALGLIVGLSLWIGPSWLQHDPRLTDQHAIRINKAHFDQITTGMTVEQIQDLLGVPPGDYRSTPGFRLVGHGHIPHTKQSIGGRLEVWYIPAHHLEVLFDHEGHAIGKYWHSDGE